MSKKENLDFLNLKQDDNIEKFLIYILDNIVDKQERYNLFKKIPRIKIFLCLNQIFKIFEQESKTNPGYSSAFDSKWGSFLLDFWEAHKEAGLKQLDALREK